jgi:YgiT-type zinc finger domain-containing protein
LAAGQAEGGKDEREAMQVSWSGLSEAIMEEVAVWRAAHPKATLREIEAEIDRRLSELRAKMISDRANASASEGVVCPACGAKLVKQRKKKRVLLMRDGRRIELVRDYGVCVACGQGIFPSRKA